MNEAKPLNDKAPVVRLPPKSRMTSAAPTPAPLLIPNIDGSARGLRKAVCNIKPLTASDIPDRRAVMACGNRDSMTMNCHTDFDASPPVNMLKTSPKGMSIEPYARLAMKSNTARGMSRQIFFTLLS